MPDSMRARLSTKAASLRRFNVRHGLNWTEHDFGDARVTMGV